MHLVLKGRGLHSFLSIKVVLGVRDIVSITGWYVNITDRHKKSVFVSSAA